MRTSALSFRRTSPSLESSLSQDSAMSRQVEVLVERARLRRERARPWAEPSGKSGSSTRSSPRPVQLSSSLRVRPQAPPAPISRSRPAFSSSSSRSSQSTRTAHRPVVQCEESEVLARARAVRARFEARRPKLAADVRVLPSTTAEVKARFEARRLRQAADVRVLPNAPAVSQQRRNAIALRPVPLPTARPVEKPRAVSTKQGHRVHWPESQLLATTIPSPPSSPGDRSPTVSRKFSSSASYPGFIADFCTVEPTPVGSPPPVEAALKSSLRKPSGSGPAKRVRFDDEHLDREKQVVRKEVRLFKRWIGILQVRTCAFLSCLA